VTSVPIGV